MSRFAALLALLACAPLAAQLTTYGSPTPAPFIGTLDSGGQIPYLGNYNFRLVLNDPNASGGGLAVGFAPISAPYGSATLLVDLSGASLFVLPPGVAQFPIAIANIPQLAGFTAYAQAGVFDASLPGGFGLTNGIGVSVLPDRAPRRAYIPGQNFQGAPGLMATLDLAAQPPAFRSTGAVGFAGTISNNYPLKIAVADGPQIAYALGNSASNQFVRAFDVSADPVGAAALAALGDIPTADVVGGTVGQRDMEVTSDGHYLFVATGGGNVSLQVFDCSGVPQTIPQSSVQAITYTNAGSGAVGLELSPAGDRLAVVMSIDSFPAITIYDVTPGAPQPLSLFATVPLAGVYPGFGTPSDVHFTPDGHQLFVTGADGTNGFFSVIDVQTSPPSVLIPANYWNPVAGHIWLSGSAVAAMNGAPVGIVAAEGSGASYTIFDLNPALPTFGSPLATFSTNPGGNISNHRMHARGSIVVAIDGSGALSDCEWVDVIDLDQPIAVGFAHWRLRMPTAASTTPGSGSAIPRDFDLY